MLMQEEGEEDDEGEADDTEKSTDGEIDVGIFLLCSLPVHMLSSSLHRISITC